MMVPNSLYFSSRNRESCEISTEIVSKFALTLMRDSCMLSYGAPSLERLKIWALVEENVRSAISGFVSQNTGLAVVPSATAHLVDRREKDGLRPRFKETAWNKIIFWDAENTRSRVEPSRKNSVMQVSHSTMANGLGNPPSAVMAPQNIKR
jgi:hypothetical protein